MAPRGAPYPLMRFPHPSLQMANGTEALLRGLEGAYPILTDLEALGADMDFTALQQDLQVGSATGRGSGGSDSRERERSHKGLAEPPGAYRVSHPLHDERRPSPPPYPCSPQGVAALLDAPAANPATLDAALGGMAGAAAALRQQLADAKAAADAASPPVAALSLGLGPLGTAPADCGEWSGRLAALQSEMEALAADTGP